MELMLRRKHVRTVMVLTVRVAGRDSQNKRFDALTHTLDIAVDGARVGGLFNTALRKGDVVEVRRNHRKARFRVAWVGEAGTRREGQIGIQSIDAPAGFWGLEIPEHGEVPLPFDARIASANHASGD